MINLQSAQAKPAPPVSFEFFPPRTEQMEKALWSAIRRLAPLEPAFVSVTYGAGGSTRERTHTTVKRIQKETGLKAAAHLTCIGATKAEVDEVIRAYWEAGIRHIVALRGDPPEGVGEPYRPHKDGYENAADLTAGIKRIADFEVSVGTYPEKHPDSPSHEADIEMLRRKAEAGASRAITQFAFDDEVMARYRDDVRRAGIDIPIIPGIMPINSFAGIKRFASRCGASIPRWLAHIFEGLDEDPSTRAMVASVVAAEQCFRLREHGFDQFHFYTLNKADLSYAACYMLGLRPKGQSQ